MFRRSLLDVKPRIYRTVEDRLRACLGVTWRVPPSLRWDRPAHDVQLHPRVPGLELAVLLIEPPRVASGQWMSSRSGGDVIGQ